MSIEKVNGLQINPWGISNLGKWDGETFESGTPEVWNDFKILRGTSVITSGNTTVTITEGVDYSLESGVTSSKCYIRIVNTRKTGMGNTSGGRSQVLNNFTAYISNPSNIETSITFTRINSVGDTRIDWEIVQYTGDAGGPNEIVVAHHEVITMAASVTEDTTTTVVCTGTTNGFVWEYAPILTSQASGYAGYNVWGDALAVVKPNWASDPEDADFLVKRGTSQAAGYFSVATIRWKGSNWRVQFYDGSLGTGAADWTPTTDGYTDVTLSITEGMITNRTGHAARLKEVLDRDKCMAQILFTDDNTTMGLDDAGIAWSFLSIDSNNDLVFRRQARTTISGDCSLWLFENLGSGTGAMDVERVMVSDDSINLGTEEREWTETLTESHNMLESIIMGECCSIDGSGVAYPRGSINLRLTAQNTVTLIESDDGEERRIHFERVMLPYCTAHASAPTVYEDLATVDFDAPAQTYNALNIRPAIRIFKFTSTSDVNWYRLKNLSSSPVEPSFDLAFLVRLLNLDSVSSGLIKLELYDENMHLLTSTIPQNAESGLTVGFPYYNGSGWEYPKFYWDTTPYLYLKVTPVSSSSLNLSFAIFTQVVGASYGYMDSQKVATINWGANYGDQTGYIGDTNDVCLHFFYWDDTYTYIRVYHNQDGNTFFARRYHLYSLGTDGNYRETYGQNPVASGVASASDQNTLEVRYNPSGPGFFMLLTSVDAVGSSGTWDFEIKR